MSVCLMHLSMLQSTTPLPPSLTSQTLSVPLSVCSVPHTESEALGKGKGLWLARLPSTIFGQGWEFENVNSPYRHLPGHALKSNFLKGGRLAILEIHPERYLLQSNPAQYGVVGHKH